MDIKQIRNLTIKKLSYIHWTSFVVFEHILAFFSNDGYSPNAHRKRLSPQNFEIQMFLYANDSFRGIAYVNSVVFSHKDDDAADK